MLVTSSTLVASAFAVATLSLLRWNRILWISSALLTAVAFVMAWSKFPQFLYLYRDGAYNLLLSNLYSSWAEPLDVTSINPLSGMVSMLVPVNPYFNPGQWPFLLGWTGWAGKYASYLIYLSEVSLTTYWLGRILDLPRLPAICAAILSALLLFPPFNFTFGLQSWFSAAPMYGHALALTNLCMITLFSIGRPGVTRNAGHVINAGLALIFVVLFAAILIGAPFYFAGMMVGAAMMFACVLFSSENRHQFAARSGALVLALALMVALGMPEFYGAAKSSSARYLGNQSLLHFAFSDNDLTRPNRWELVAEGFCAWGIRCAPMPGWPFAMGAEWVYGATVIGAATVAVMRGGQTARFALAFLILVLSLALFWILQALSVIVFGLSPSFLYLMTYSTLSIFCIHALFTPARFILSKLDGWWLWMRPYFWRFTPIFAFILAATFINLVSERFVANPGDILVGPVMPTPPVTPLIDRLREEIQLQPGGLFRGSVATILGAPGGTLRSELQMSETTPLIAGQFEKFLAAAAKSGSTHDLLDLWNFDIPTMSEYGQGISRPLAFFANAFLSDGASGFETHFIIPKALNRDVLRAMGVRYVVTDLAREMEGLVARGSVAAGEKGVLHLYELSNPNLGTFSPTKFEPLVGQNAFIRRLTEEPGALETTAFLGIAPPGPLQKVTRSQLVFEKRGIRVRASSAGWSALLLPVQFSHCYTVKPLVGTATLHRANMLHSLLIFEGEIDVRLRWRFDFWRGSSCRARDVADFNAWPE